VRRVSLAGTLAGAALVVAAIAAAPQPRDLAEFAAWGARPLVLPFAWSSLLEAERGGDPSETFARAQNLMRLMPSWADGFAAFAYRYALADEDVSIADPAVRGRRALARLDLANAWLEAARPQAGRHEPTLLQALAWLPEIAVRHEPELARLLPPGGAAAIADRWFDESERRFPSAAAREQRTFYAPRLAAGMLAAGNRTGAVAVLRTAIERSHAVRDRELAAEWRARLQEVVRWLEGDRTVDLTAVRADTRLQSLLPHLR
jgi:hypothetical protein